MSNAYEPAEDSAPAAFRNPGDPTPWTGFVTLAGAILLIAGAGQVIGGVVALLDDGYYDVADDRLAVPVSYDVWGWVHLAIGVAVIVAALGVLARQRWAQAIAVVIVIVNTLVNVTFLKAYPFGSMIVIAFNLLVIYSLVAHGREMVDDRVPTAAGPPATPFIRTG